MISNEAIEAYNSRLTVDLSKMSTLSPAQRDRVRDYGGRAEALLLNKDFAMFIHHHKFEISDQIASIRGHSPDDNALRIALGNELSGIDSFVNSLKRAVHLKARIGNTNEVPNQ